jgi:hypothetical protein
MATCRVLPPGVLPPGGSSFSVTVGGRPVYPGAQPGATAVTLPGRTYTAAPGQVLDVPDFDAAALQAQGWIAISFGLSARIQGGSGPSTQRPSPPWVGCHFFDTTLGKLVVYDGGAWRDPANGNSV